MPDIGPSNKPQWTFLVRKWLPCSESFERQMDLQLRGEFAEKTGYDLSDFVYGPETCPQLFTVRRSGLVGYVVGSIGAEGLSFIAAIAWVDRQEKRFIEPTDRVSAEDVRFWWHVLPVEELVAEQNNWPEPPFDPKRFSFAIDYRLKTWPHVIFTIAFEEPIDERRRLALQDSCVAIFDDWRRTGKPGVIHEAGFVTRIDECTVDAAVDLGSAGPDGMVYVLDRIEAFGGVASVKIRAGG